MFGSMENMSRAVRYILRSLKHYGTLTENVTSNSGLIRILRACRLTPTPHGGAFHELRCIPSRCVHAVRGLWTHGDGTQRNA